ncbi:MAG TPA: hypothetical protein VIY49_05845 [Bryobacteraceae bacterium]
MNRKYLRLLSALILALCATMALQAKNKKAEKFFRQGQAAQAKNDWDTAVQYYQQAVDLDSQDPEYLIAMRKARFEAGTRHVKSGQKLRDEGKLAEAMQEFQKGIITDPSSAIALQEMKRTQQTIDKVKEGLTKPDEAHLTPAERIRREDEQKIESMEGPPQLKPAIRELPPIKMNNQPPRILYETVGKLAGVNVVFDSQYTPPPPGRGFNMELGSSTVGQAFDYLAVLTHTYWKPMAPTTIFVTEDNPTKRRDYEDQVVKVFYVTNASTVQEFQEIATAIRTVADIRRVYTYNAQKAMIVRGTVDQVAMAEKLVRSLDKPKAEVVVECIFMEVSTDKTLQLAATLATAGTAGINVPISFTPTNTVNLNGSTSSTSTTSSTTTTSTTTTTTPTTTPTTGTATTPTTGATIASLGHISSADFATSLPGGLLQAMVTDNRTKVLATPSVRVSDGAKGELQVGSRIPYATGSFQPGVGTVGVSPLVSTQFNFADTGTTMVIQPQVHSSTEVTLHVEITVSAVSQYVNLGGISQPVIAQNKNIADLRVRDGETSILGGLDEIQDSLSVNGIPGLVNIPAIGGILFGSTNKEKDKTQLLIALIPHIVRTPDYSADDLRGIYAGTETTVKINYGPQPENVSPASAPLAQAPPATPPAAPAPGGPARGTPVPAPAPGAAPPAVAPPPPGPPPSFGQARLSLSPAPIQVAPNTEFTATLRLDNAADVFSISPLRIKFDPAVVRLSDVTAGDFMGPVTLEKDIRNDSGDATLTFTRPPGSSGVNGSGVLATLKFMAVAAGAGPISISEAQVKNSQLQAVPAAVGSVPVTVR